MGSLGEMRLANKRAEEGSPAAEEEGTGQMHGSQRRIHCEPRGLLSFKAMHAALTRMACHRPIGSSKALTGAVRCLGKAAPAVDAALADGDAPPQRGLHLRKALAGGEDPAAAAVARGRAWQGGTDGRAIVLFVFL